jgi:hypothetical protein
MHIAFFSILLSPPDQNDSAEKQGEPFRHLFLLPKHLIENGNCNALDHGRNLGMAMLVLLAVFISRIIFTRVWTRTPPLCYP